MELLAMKNKDSEMKNTLDGFKSRLDTQEGMTSEYEDHRNYPKYNTLRKKTKTKTKKPRRHMSFLQSFKHLAIMGSITIWKDTE